MLEDQEVPKTAPEPAASVAVPPSVEHDAELKAMQTIVGALKLLGEEERRRVLEYVLGRYGVFFLSPGRSAETGSIGVIAAEAGQSNTPHGALGSIRDIRSLKEAKAPATANEMAALVAYYVSELAPPGDRKNEITRADIERYFKSAGFKLPANASFTLVNAKNAGYLDSAGSGQFKLNPVGYNLVVHRMGETDEGKPSRARKKKALSASRKKAARGKKK